MLLLNCYAVKVDSFISEMQTSSNESEGPDKNELGNVPGSEKGPHNQSCFSPASILTHNLQTSWERA